MSLDAASAETILQLLGVILGSGAVVKGLDLWARRHSREIEARRAADDAVADLIERGVVLGRQQADRMEAEMQELRERLRSETELRIQLQVRLEEVEAERDHLRQIVSRMETRILDLEKRDGAG